MLRPDRAQDHAPHPADQGLHFELNRLFEPNETVEKAVSDAAETLLNRFPFHQWKLLPEGLKEPHVQPARQIYRFTRSAVRDVAAHLWKHKYGQPTITDDYAQILRYSRQT